MGHVYWVVVAFRAVTLVTHGVRYLAFNVRYSYVIVVYGRVNGALTRRVIWNFEFKTEGGIIWNFEFKTEGGVILNFEFK